MRVLLASTSPARLALLRQTGIEPILMSPNVDEEALAAELGANVDAETLVSELARAKARDVAARVGDAYPDFDGVVIGGDSMFELDGTLYGKPYEPEVATERWQRMRGNTGTLHSGHCVIRIGPEASEHEVTEVTRCAVSFVDDIDDEEIAAYVATGEPLFVAGSFTIDGMAAGFIDHIDGDPSTVVGMSLPTLRRLVRDVGLEWHALWNAPAAN